MVCHSEEPFGGVYTERSRSAQGKLRDEESLSWCKGIPRLRGVHPEINRSLRRAQARRAPAQNDNLSFSCGEPIGNIEVVRIG